MSDEEEKLKRMAASQQNQANIRAKKNMAAGREPNAPFGRKAHQARKAAKSRGMGRQY
jgi:hypothetical protein